MKALLIFPPFVSPEEGPYLSVPLLVGQLVANGVMADGLDLNLDFNNYILSKKYLLEIIKNLENIIETSKNEKHVSLIKSVIVENKQLVDVVIENIDNAVSQIKKLENDNYVEKYEYSYIIENAFKIVALQYYPSSFLPSKDVSLNYSDIKKWSFNESENIYIDYFKKKIEDIKKENYDFIGVTIPSTIQLGISFTLLRLLKENTNAKIIAGGNILYSIWENIAKYPEIFDIYCDGFITGEGEKAIVQYADYVAGKISKTEVAGLLWKNENSQIIKNDEVSIKNVKEIKPAIFNEKELINYFSSNISIPVQFSKGCYWHKCSFCTAHKGKPFYSIKTPKEAVDVLEDIINKYNISNFSILDDAISPDFFEKFADEILNRGLKIKYAAFLRLEKPYDYALLEKLHRSGLWRAFWGYEAESERIITLMNKGVDLESRKQILKTAHEVGITNAVGIIFGFPTETEEEMQESLDFCSEHFEYIDTYMPFVFELRRKSALLLNKDKYSIKNISDTEEFSYFCEYEDVVPVEVKRLYQQQVVKLQKKKMLEKNKNIAFRKKSSLLN